MNASAAQQIDYFKEICKKAAPAYQFSATRSLSSLCVCACVWFCCCCHCKQGTLGFSGFSSQYHGWKWSLGPLFIYWFQQTGRLDCGNHTKGGGREGISELHSKLWQEQDLSKTVMGRSRESGHGGDHCQERWAKTSWRASLLSFSIAPQIYPVYRWYIFRPTLFIKVLPVVQKLYQKPNIQLPVEQVDSKLLPLFSTVYVCQTFDTWLLISISHSCGGSWNGRAWDEHLNVC